MPYIEDQDWKLYYHKKGTENRPVMLFFHGFGQEGESFRPLVNAIQKDFTCYVFDLFYHGKSVAPEESTLELSLWNRIFNIFLAREKIEQFSLTGFSLGGKYVLAIYMEHMKRVEEIRFIAPDGIKTNIWYSMATYPYPLRRLFRSMIRHPHRLFVIARVLRTLKILDKSLVKFVELQMKTPQQRVKVYNTWVGMRHFKYDTEEIVDAIVQQNTYTTIFLGKHDKVIPPKDFQGFADRIPSCNLRILDCGHNTLIEATANYYANNSN